MKGAKALKKEGDAVGKSEKKLADFRTSQAKLIEVADGLGDLLSNLPSELNFDTVA